MSKRQAKCQVGATLPLIVFVLTALLGVAALALDVGLMELARQRAQNVADAAALAGSQNPGTEGAAAASVTTANNLNGSAFQGSTTSVNSDGSVTVRGYVNAPLAFAPAVGYAPTSTDGAADTLSVMATATAAMQNVCGLPPGMPVVPFGVIGDDPSSTDPAIAEVAALLSGRKTLTPGAYQPVSSQVTLYLNVWSNSTGNLTATGNFDPLLISGSGATYLETIRQTSSQTISAGQTLQTAPPPLNGIDNTRLYVAARLSQSNTAYSHAYATYDTWFTAGSPMLPDGQHPEDHFLIVPVVSQAIKNKQGTVTVLALALFFVDQPFPVGTSGGNIVRGRFLSLTIPGGAGGVCAGAGSKTPPALLQ